MRYLRCAASWCCAIAPAVVVLAAGTPALAQAAWTITAGPTSGFGILRDAYAASPTNAWAVGAQSGAGRGHPRGCLEGASR